MNDSSESVLHSDAYAFLIQVKKISGVEVCLFPKFSFNVPFAEFLRSSGKTYELDDIVLSCFSKLSLYFARMLKEIMLHDKAPIDRNLTILNFV